jgi:hypothetical protein
MSALELSISSAFKTAIPGIKEKIYVYRVFWLVDLLLGNDHGISKYATAVAK